MPKTNGISPKVLAATITGVVVYLITKLGLQVDPVIEQAINVGAVLLAAYFAPPGDVTAPTADVASDDLLSAEAKAQIDPTTPAKRKPKPKPKK